MFGPTLQTRKKGISALLVDPAFWGLLWWPLKSLVLFGIQRSVVQLYTVTISALLLLPFVWGDLARLRGEISY